MRIELKKAPRISQHQRTQRITRSMAIVNMLLALYAMTQGIENNFNFMVALICLASVGLSLWAGGDLEI